MLQSSKTTPQHLRQTSGTFYKKLMCTGICLPQSKPICISVCGCKCIDQIHEVREGSRRTLAFSAIKIIKMSIKNKLTNFPQILQFNFSRTKFIKICIGSLLCLFYLLNFALYIGLLPSLIYFIKSLAFLLTMFFFSHFYVISHIQIFSP